jgi:hypothetical protein
MFKKFLLVLLVIFIALQFFRPEKNIAKDQNAALKNDITVKHGVPADIKQMLEVACNDCHSNNTRYPWYSNIQPSAWFLADHVEDGKKELNFNEFSAYRLRRQYHKFEEIEEMVEQGIMPLSSYTWIHRDAILSEDQKAAIINWAKSSRAKMEAIYPMDSLVRKK